MWQTNQNCRQEQTESMLISWNAWYSSVQNLFSSLLLSTNIKIKTENCRLVCCFARECYPSLMLWGKHCPRVFEIMYFREF
jgi:hypothetical protein